MSQTDGSAPEPMAKGSNLVGLLAAVEGTFGKPLAEQLLADCPAELAAAFRDNKVLIGGWYPLAWYKTMHRAAQRLSGRDERLAWELAHRFVFDQLGGVYKALMKLISPHWLFNFPSLIFSRYFDTGKLVVPESRAGFVRGVWSGCRGFDRNIWYATMGGSQAALERAGAKNVRIEIIRAGGDGDDEAEATGAWS